MPRDQAGTGTFYRARGLFALPAMSPCITVLQVTQYNNQIENRHIMDIS